MIKEIAGGEICGDIVDIYPQEVKPFPVTLSYAGLDNLVGKHIPSDTVDSILRSLEIDILRHNADGTADLLVPTYRVDVTRPCDVIEDVLRIYGYNNVEFPGSLHASLSFKTLTDNTEDIRRTIAGQLTAAGFNEILNNSLTAARYYTGLTTYPEEKLRTPSQPPLKRPQRNAPVTDIRWTGISWATTSTARKPTSCSMRPAMYISSIQPYSRMPTSRLLPTPKHRAWRYGSPGRHALATGHAQPEEATVYDLRARRQHPGPPRHIHA